MQYHRPAAVTLRRVPGRQGVNNVTVLGRQPALVLTRPNGPTWNESSPPFRGFNLAPRGECVPFRTVTRDANPAPARESMHHAQSAPNSAPFVLARDLVGYRAAGGSAAAVHHPPRATISALHGDIPTHPASAPPRRAAHVPLTGPLLALQKGSRTRRAALASRRAAARRSLCSTASSAAGLSPRARRGRPRPRRPPRPAGLCAPPRPRLLRPPPPRP